MKQETAQVERLDFSKPPKDYEAVALLDSLAAAWSFYKTRHDPPGVVPCGPLGLFVAFGPGLPQFLSRASAWAWYERRLGLARQLETSGHPCEGSEDSRTVCPACDAWPGILTWSDDEVAAAELEQPDVAVCAGCIGAGPCECGNGPADSPSEVEEQDPRDEFCSGCGAARDEMCHPGCPRLGGET